MKLISVTTVVVLLTLAVIMSIQSACAYSPYNPVIIALDSDGNVYGLIAGNRYVSDCVHVFTPQGGERVIPLSGIIDLATDDNGNIYLLNESLHNEKRQISIVKLSRNGQTDSVFKNDSSKFHPGYVIGSMTVSRSGSIYLYDYYTLQDSMDDGIGSWPGYPVGNLARIAQIDPTGAVGKTYAWNQTPDLSGVPRLSVDAAGDIYVADYGSDVKVIGPDGTIKHLCGDVLADSPLLVCDVDVSSDGCIYLAECHDKYNSSGKYDGEYWGRIQKFKPDGTLVGTWDGCGPDRFLDVITLAVDSKGMVYVADPNNQRIVWFDSNKYTYGSILNDNTNGRGVLWDNVVAGDNFTTADQKRQEDMGIVTAVPSPSPGFEVLLPVISLAMAGLMIYVFARRRQ